MVFIECTLCAHSLTTVEMLALFHVSTRNGAFRALSSFTSCQMQGAIAVLPGEVPTFIGVSFTHLWSAKSAAIWPVGSKGIVLWPYGTKDYGGSVEGQ